MTFWQWLYKVGPGWPSERQWVAISIVGVLGFMLQMAVDNPGLWDIELFKIILQAIAITGLLNMILAFHYAANKADEVKTENTARAFEAITATAHASGGGDPNAIRDGDKVTVEKGEP